MLSRRDSSLPDIGMDPTAGAAGARTPPDRASDSSVPITT